MMKTKLLIVIIVFSVSNVFAQSDSLSFQKKMDALSNKIGTLEKSIEQVKTENQAFAEDNQSLMNSQNILRRENKQLIQNFDAYKQNAERKTDSLQRVINSNSANIKKTANELGVKIDETYKTTNQSITDLNKTVSQNTLYWIIAILVVALFVLLVFVLLRKQIFKQKTDLDSNLQDTRKILEEEGVKLDIKLAEILEKQLTIINEQRKKEDKTTPSEIDHSLVLKVADRLISMEKNLSRMDENTKGLKHLKTAVQSIKDNFASNGYELVEMIGKPYTPNMKVTANFIPDDNLKPGERIITRIIKPQVNYNGEMIQPAQVEVSQGD